MRSLLNVNSLINVLLIKVHLWLIRECTTMRSLMNVISVINDLSIKWVFWGTRAHTVEKSHLNVISLINILPKKKCLFTQQRTHIVEMPFKCDCGKCFSNKCYLIVNQRNYSGEKYFKCNQCDHFFPIKVFLWFIREHKMGKNFSNVINVIIVLPTKYSCLSSENIWGGEAI